MRQLKVREFASLILIFSLFLTVHHVGVRGQDSRSATPSIKALKLFYESALQRYGVVGSSFALLKDNRLIIPDYYGLANIEQKRKVDENTIYHWASITKTITGVAIMQLRDHKRLSLEDPIIKYLPELRGVHNPYGDMSEITIRHLLTHTPGFRQPTWPWKDQEWQPNPMSWEQIVAMIPYTEVLFKPGTKFSYSNLGYVFLGRLIEVLTTDDYEVYIDKNIFKPLGMYRSYFDTTPYHLMKYKSQSYFLDSENKLKLADPDINTGITVANGGLNAPLGDMIKYLYFIMGNPEQQTAYNEVLKRSSLEEMFTPQVEVSAEKNQKTWMGLSFFVEEHSGVRFVSHGGDQNAFKTRFYVNPKAKIGYVVAYNTFVGISDEKNTSTLDREIKEYIFRTAFSRL